MWLALETATDRASVAVGEGAADAVEESLEGSRRHAAALLPMVERVLRQRGTALDRLSGVLVSDGPGSFTGLRVGATAAKALVRSRGLALHAAPSLMVRAAGVADDGALVLAVADALRGDVYAAAYRFEGHRVVTVIQPDVYRPDALAEGELRPDILVGVVPAAAAAVLERWSGHPLVGLPAAAPRAARLLGLLGLEGGTRAVDEPQEWEPVYGRPAEAQARWEIAHGRPLPDSVGGGR